ncbi:MAG: LysR family transcriptional regulator [Oscillospiraceae bacterium]|nr:LysR family transcriptional regulator [Oscillospiraceae bacterium]
MTLRHLKIFVNVCDENNMTRAAEKLYMAQPAVSCAIHELEEYYGITLFDRISHKLYITEQGKTFLGYARHITALFDEMEKQVKNADALGGFRVGASNTVGTVYMPSIIAEFKRLYNDFIVSVCVNNSDTIEEMLLKNELDFAIIEGIVHSDNIICRPISFDRLAVVCRPDNPLLKEPFIDIERFASEPFLLRERSSGTREMFENAMAMLGYTVKPLWESTNTEALIMAVINNLGISVLPYVLVKQYIKLGQVSELTVEKLRLDRQLCIIYHKNKFLSPVMRDFLMTCEKSIDHLHE